MSVLQESRHDGAGTVRVPPGGVNRVNWLLTALSLLAVVITVERVSPTTTVLLGPNGYLHLHEFLQMGAITAASTIISFLLLRAVSGEFAALRDLRYLILGCLFILGSYYYATGNGAHEVASFMFNQFCNTKHFSSAPCRAMYADDYYYGNIVYFLGLGLSDLALILIERDYPGALMDRKNLWITIGNGLLLALTFFVYDAFDRVSIGLVSTVVYALVFGALLLTARAPGRALPFTLYSTLGFAAAAVAAVPVRLLTGH